MFDADRGLWSDDFRTEFIVHSDRTRRHANLRSGGSKPPQHRSDETPFRQGNDLVARHHRGLDLAKA